MYLWVDRYSYIGTEKCALNIEANKWGSELGSKMQLEFLHFFKKMKKCLCRYVHLFWGYLGYKTGEIQWTSLLYLALSSAWSTKDLLLLWKPARLIQFFLTKYILFIHTGKKKELKTKGPGNIIWKLHEAAIIPKTYWMLKGPSISGLGKDSGCLTLNDKMSIRETDVEFRSMLLFHLIDC